MATRQLTRQRRPCTDAAQATLGDGSVGAYVEGGEPSLQGPHSAAVLSARRQPLPLRQIPLPSHHNTDAAVRASKGTMKLTQAGTAEGFVVRAKPQEPDMAGSKAVGLWQTCAVLSGDCPHLIFSP